MFYIRSYFSIVSMLLFIVLKHNPLRILNMLQNTLRNFKKNVNIYDKYVNECNYFLTNEKIRDKLKFYNGEKKII